MKKFWRFLGACGVFLWSCSALFAAEKVVLSTGDWEPYTSAKAEGQGVFTEILSAAFQELGLQPQYEFYPWKRTELVAREGQVFAAFPYIETEERKKDFDFSEVVMFSTGRFFYLKSKYPQGVEYQKFSDLQPYVIGGVSGYWYKKDFDEAKLNVEYVTSDEQSVKKLFNKRVDFAAMDELVGWGLIKMLYPQEEAQFTTLKTPLNQSNLRLMVSRTYPKSQELLKQFNQGLATIKSKGSYQKILEKYGIRESE